MLYPQNGDRIAAIDSVTSRHPMYTPFTFTLPNNTRGRLTLKCAVLWIYRMNLMKVDTRAQRGYPQPPPVIEAAHLRHLWWTVDLLFLPYTKCRCNSSARANVEQTNPHDTIRLGEVSHVEAWVSRNNLKSKELIFIREKCGQSPQPPIIPAIPSLPEHRTCQLRQGPRHYNTIWFWMCEVHAEADR